MILKINGEEVSWSDMEASSFDEALKEIQNWLLAQGWRLVSYRIHPESASRGAPALSEIDVLDIEAEVLNQTTLTHLDILILWLDSLGHGLLSRNEAVRQNCREAADQIIKSADLLFHNGINIPVNLIRNLVHEVDSGWTELQKNRLEIDQLQSQLERLKTMLLYPRESIQKLVDLISYSLFQTDGLPQLVYAQRYSEAMGLIVSILDHYSLLVFGLAQITTPDEMKQLQTECLPFFNELSEAMERMDWTYISDLWEYEIHPRLTRLVELIKLQAGIEQNASQGS